MLYEKILESKMEVMNYCFKKTSLFWILKNKWHIDTRPLQDIDSKNCPQPDKKYYRFRVNNLSMVNKLLDQHKCFSTLS